jgi:predicted HTH transcriptional regulator
LARVARLACKEGISFAVSLTDTFDNLGAHEIAEFVQLGQEENLHLDFKTVANANLRGADDKRNLAKCLSGFANSSGGIIVWGIDARKNSQGVDCAATAAEITPVRLFLSRLNELTGEAVSPIVDGVRHKIIETTPDSGFSVTLVPESISGPYMAKLGEDRYYKRSGDSFYRMEHFDLEDMFGRRQKPHLNTHLSVVPVLQDYSQEEMRITLENDGRAIAKHVSLVVQLENADITSVGGDI